MTLSASLTRVFSFKELFVQHLAVSSFNNGSGRETKSLSYSDLANTAEETETFHFLTGGILRPAGTTWCSCGWCTTDEDYWSFKSLIFFNLISLNSLLSRTIQTVFAVKTSQNSSCTNQSICHRLLACCKDWDRNKAFTLCYLTTVEMTCRIKSLHSKLSQWIHTDKFDSAGYFSFVNDSADL